MRTTLTLEPDVAERVRREIERSGKGMTAVVNEALRAALGPPAAEREKQPPFEVETHSFGFRPGIDLDRLNRLA